MSLERTECCVNWKVARFFQSSTASDCLKTNLQKQQLAHKVTATIQKKDNQLLICKIDICNKWPLVFEKLLTSHQKSFISLENILYLTGKKIAVKNIFDIPHKYKILATSK